MKKYAVIVLIVFSNIIVGQNSKFVGLYNECAEEYSGYICQQFQLFDDSTFILYDLLHLRGWSLTNGTWHVSQDTLYLKSNPRDIKINYIGNSNSDSIKINFLVDSFLPAYSTIKTDSIYQLDSLGNCTVWRKSASNLMTQFLGVPQTKITFDSNKLASANEIRVSIESESLELFYFDNEKWLIKDGKIYHTLDSLGNYDKEIYYEKTKLDNLKYKKN